MKRVYLVVEMNDSADINATSVGDLDDLADDLLRVVHGVTAVALYPSLQEMVEDEAPSSSAPSP